MQGFMTGLNPSRDSWQSLSLHQGRPCTLLWQTGSTAGLAFIADLHVRVKPRSAENPSARAMCRTGLCSVTVTARCHDLGLGSSDVTHPQQSPCLGTCTARCPPATAAACPAAAAEWSPPGVLTHAACPACAGIAPGRPGSPLAAPAEMM